MSERKAINKYYPPDYDPSKVPKVKRDKNAAIKVRLSAPFSMRCLNCNEYISSSRKFNAKKTVTDEKYLEVKIIQFQIRCPICNNNIVFKTHPQSGGFTLESGAKRNFEPTKALAVPKTETPDEILDRLIREEEENKKFQEQREQRKTKKFWKDNKQEDLNEKLVQQQSQVEINEHLEYLQAKNRRLQEMEKKLGEAKEASSTESTEEDTLIREKLAAFKKYQPEKRPLPQATPLVIKKKTIAGVKRTETRAANEPKELKGATETHSSQKTDPSQTAAKPNLALVDYSSDEE